MNQFWVFSIVLSLLMFIHYSNGKCEIDPYDKSITVHNLRKNCNSRELLSIFSNLTTGPFPPEGKLKGHVLECFGRPCGFIDNIWDGKTIIYTGGTPPNDHGTATNRFFGRIVKFDANIYRTIAPIDGKEVFAIDYKRDRYVFFIMDYLREVQTNLYLGITALQKFERKPFLFFLLEKV